MGYLRVDCRAVVFAVLDTLPCPYCEGCPSSKVVRGRWRLSPPAWVAAPSLRLGNVFCINPGETTGKPRRGTRDERRETNDLEWHDSRY